MRTYSMDAFSIRTWIASIIMVLCAVFLAVFFMINVHSTPKKIPVDTTKYTEQIKYLEKQLTLREADLQVERQKYIALQVNYDKLCAAIGNWKQWLEETFEYEQKGAVK